MSNLRRPAYLLVVLSALACAVTLVWHPARASRFTGLASVRARIPAQVAGYESPGEEQMDSVVRGALGTADLYQRTYTDQSGHTAQLVLIGGTDRNALHDPRSCMVGAGWRIEDDHTEAVPGTSVTARSCRLVGGAGGAAYEVLYLYVVDGQIVNQATQIRSQMMLSALVGKKNRPVCFVRFLRPLSPGALSDEVEHARFLRFAGETWNQMRLTDVYAAQGTE